MSVITSVWGPIIGSDTQSWDADLDSVAAQSGLGLLVHTAANTYGIRTLAAPAAGLAITNPAGTAGNPTFALANDLAALEGLGSTGLAARSATDTWVQRTITGTSPVTVTNGDGVSGNPTISMDVGPWTAIDMSTGTVSVSAPSTGLTWELVFYVASSEGITGNPIPTYINGDTTVTNYWLQIIAGANAASSVTEANNAGLLLYQGSTGLSGGKCFNRVIIPNFRDANCPKLLINTATGLLRAAGDATVGQRLTYRTGASSGAVNDAVTSIGYTLPNSGTHASGSWGYHRWRSA